MSLNNQLRTTFKSIACTYDDVAIVPHEIGIRLLEQLQFLTMKPLMILDLGCGTGLTTQKLLKSIRHDKSYACDFAQNLLFLASKR